MHLANMEERLRRLEASHASLLAVAMRLLARSFQETGIPKEVWNEVIERSAAASEHLKTRPGLTEKDRRKVDEVTRIIRSFSRLAKAPKGRNIQ